MVVDISKGVHQWGQNRTVFLLHPDSPSRSQHGLGLMGKPNESYTIWASVRENLSSGVCEQQRRRPACASAQTDQRLCYSLFAKYHI